MNYIDIFKNGSGIHIKKANRGKFTDYCGGKVTSECISKGKHSSDPAVRKRATFAANARKWKHEEGGVIKGKEGILTNYRSADISEELNDSGSQILDPSILEITKRFIANKYNKASDFVENKSNEVKNKWEEFYNTYANTSEPEKQSSVTTTIKDISDDLKTLLGMFSKAGIKVRMTSGYREGATTKQGNPSHHATGHAMDIVPENGDFKALALAIKTNPEISAFMKSKGLGILDETSAEMLAKTGGSGAHFHVGPDKIAQNFWLA